MNTTNKISYAGKSVEVIIKNPNDHIQKRWVQGNFYECHANGVLPYIFKNYSPKKVIDIGASIGNHTLFFSGIMGVEHVVSVEPHLPSFAHLTSNVRINRLPNQLLNIALSDANGMCDMKPISENNVGMVQVGVGASVEMSTMDSFKDGTFDNFDIMKIDVEHHNKELLTGAMETFKRNNGDIFIEAETNEVLAVTDAIMNECGYVRQAGVWNHTPTYLYKKG